MVLEREHRKLFFAKVKELKEEGLSQYSIQMLVSLYDANDDLPDLIPFEYGVGNNYEAEIKSSLKEINLVLLNNEYELRGIDVMYAKALDLFSVGEHLDSLKTVYQMKAALGRNLNPEFPGTINSAFEEVYMQVINNNFKDVITKGPRRMNLNTRK